MMPTTLTVEELISVLNAVKERGNPEDVAYWESLIAAKSLNSPS